jgi:hypothetical protein
MAHPFAGAPSTFPALSITYGCSSVAGFLPLYRQEVMDMNRGRWMVLAFASALLLTGYIVGRSTSPGPTAAAIAVPSPNPSPSVTTAASPANLPMETSAEVAEAVPAEFRAAYGEGFKQGFAEGLKSNESGSSVSSPRRTTTSVRRVYYQQAPRPVFYERKKNSTLKTVLTIAAPAAIGAGVGAAVGGGKGAGAGALIGGGGGALWHLIRNR